MVVNLTHNIELQLRRLAEQQGRPLADLLEDAVREYIAAAAITDLTQEQVAETQMALSGELDPLPPYNSLEGDIGAPG